MSLICNISIVWCQVAASSLYWISTNTNTYYGYGAAVRQLLLIWVAIYSQIILCMQNILILIITYYRITTVIIKITDQNIVIWE